MNYSKSRFWLAALALSLFGLAGQASANDNAPYIGTGAGLYYVDIDGVGLDATAPTWRFFGGYTFNKYISVEGGYTNLFKISEDIAGVGVDMKGSSYDVLARPTLPVGNNFEVFGIVGYSWYDWEVSAEFLGQSIDTSEKDSELLYGLGAAWHLNQRLSLRGEWANVNVSDANFGMFTAAVSYSFR